MDDIILSARNGPFKLERHATNAIKGKPGYVVEKIDGGYVGKFSPDEPKESLSDNSGKDIVCPGCFQSFHTTTAKYTPDTNSNPAMLDLKPQYKSWGWDELVKDSSMGFGCLVCPGCGASLAPGGKLKVK